MATVTGYTAAKMDEINNATVVDGSVVGDDLVLVTRGGTNINAGNVRGPAGPNGPAMLVVMASGDLPNYTPGTGHDTEVAFVDNTNEFWMYSDGTDTWTKIASTMPAVIENPVLLAAPGTDALFGHVTPGTAAGFKVTSAGGLILTSLTDIRFNTPAGEIMKSVIGHGMSFLTKFAIDDSLYFYRDVNTLKLMDKNLATFKSLQAQNLTAEGTSLLKGAVTLQSTLAAAGLISAPNLSASSQVSAATVQATNSVTANVVNANSSMTIPMAYISNGVISNNLDANMITILDGGPAGSPNGNDYWSTHCGLRIISDAGDATALIAFNVADAGWAAMFGMTAVGGSPNFSCLNLANTGYVPINAAAFTVNSTVVGKEQIENLTGSTLAKIKQIKGKKYKRKTVEEDIPKEVGVLAEDLEAAGLGDIVMGDGIHKGYSLAGLVTHLLDAVVELTAKVEVLEAQLAGT